MAPSKSLACGRTIWDDKARSDLLQAIIQEAAPTSSQWERIISRVQAQGYTYTSDAALQHLQKLKRKEPGPPPTPGADGDAKASGSKAKRKATPKRKKAAANDDDDDADEPETPTKKPKKQAKEEDHSNIKFEPQMDEDDEAGVA